MNWLTDVLENDLDPIETREWMESLKAVLDGLGAKAEVRLLPGKTHSDLYVEGDDRRALLKKMAWEMYAVARPGSTLPAQTGNAK